MFKALKNLLPFRKPTQNLMSLKDAAVQDFAHDYSITAISAQSPISVLGEIDDNSLQVLGLIMEAADQLGVDLFNSNLYQYYHSAVHGEVLPDGLDEDELELMREWTSSRELPDRFCVQLLEFFDRADGVGESIKSLSQHRYERLRTWSNCHVH